MAGCYSIIEIVVDEDVTGSVTTILISPRGMSFGITQFVINSPLLFA